MSNRQRIPVRRAPDPAAKVVKNEWIDENKLTELAKDPKNRVMRFVEGSLPDGVKQQKPEETYFMINLYRNIVADLVRTYPDLNEKHKIAQTYRFKGEDDEAERLENDLRREMKSRIATQVDIKYGDKQDETSKMRVAQHHYFIHFMPKILDFVCMPRVSTAQLSQLYTMLIYKMEEEQTGGMIKKTDQDVMAYLVKSNAREPTPLEKSKIASGVIPTVPEHVFGKGFSQIMKK